jgi:SAM-dependent methyltransferase
MDNALQVEKFQDLVGNPRIFSFIRDVITESYLAGMPGYEREMAAVLEQAFARLEAACSDPARFQAAVAGLREDLFRKQDPEFWFNRLYRRYKRELKPEYRFNSLRGWLAGRRILDLGCGDGMISLVLQRHGYEPYLTDVLDYRDQAAKSLPFAPMARPDVIPFPGLHFDTAIVFVVLHHVESQALRPLLNGLRQSSSRVIIEEDSYAVPSDQPGLASLVVQDSRLKEFMALTFEDQRRCLMFIDYWANAIAQGLPQMDMPYNFKTVGEWQALFSEIGFRLLETRVMGFQKVLFNRSCHVRFLLEAQPA